MHDMPYDDLAHLDLEEKASNQFGSHRSKDLFAEMLKENLPSIYRQFLWLPKVDQDYYRLYYLQGFSQRHIKTILDISLSAVGRRVHSVQAKLRFLLLMPSLDPILVKEDLQALIGELWETAVFYYWENNQTRVATLLETTPSGASYRLDKIIALLKEKSEQEETKYVALPYYEFFVGIKTRVNVINHVFKKEDLVQRECARPYDDRNMYS